VQRSLKSTTMMSEERSIPQMLKCAWSYGNSKLESGYQQHSNNRSSMMYDSDLAEDIWQGISGIYLCSLFALFKSTLRFFPFSPLEN
jgi:hypothetical protein